MKKQYSIGFLVLAFDYLKTKKKLWRIYLISLIPTIIYVVSTIFFNIDIKVSKVFDNFVNAQITGISIIMSFSIAIITLLVSSDSKNIQEVKDTDADDEYKLLDGRVLNLFQVLLSNIAYNIMIEIVFILLLFFELFTQYILADITKSTFMSIDLFFLSHIILSLLNSVTQMYYTFWKSK